MTPTYRTLRTGPIQPEAPAGLGLSAGGELDLLIKWLGKEYSEQARTLKAVNIRQPQVGLMMVWQRLEEHYGSPDRLEDFPKVTYKDPHKLHDLDDLLLELEAAKMDHYLPYLPRHLQRGGSHRRQASIQSPG